MQGLRDGNLNLGTEICRKPEELFGACEKASSTRVNIMESEKLALDQ